MQFFCLFVLFPYWAGLSNISRKRIALPNIVQSERLLINCTVESSLISLPRISVHPSEKQAYLWKTMIKYRCRNTIQDLQCLLVFSPMYLLTIVRAFSIFTHLTLLPVNKSPSPTVYSITNIRNAVGCLF